MYHCKIIFQKILWKLYILKHCNNFIKKILDVLKLWTKYARNNKMQSACEYFLKTFWKYSFLLLTFCIYIHNTFWMSGFSEIIYFYSKSWVWVKVSIVFETKCHECTLSINLRSAKIIIVDKLRRIVYLMVYFVLYVLQMG